MIETLSGEKSSPWGTTGIYKIEKFNRIVVRSLQKSDFKEGFTCRRHLGARGALSISPH